MAGKLVLGMQEKNWIQIGDSIVTLEEIRGNRIRVSIQAPKDVLVLRDRVVEKASKSNGQAKVRRVQPGHK